MAKTIQIILDTQMKLGDVKTQVAQIEKWFKNLDSNKLGEGLTQKLSQGLLEAKKNIEATEKQLNSLSTNGFSKTGITSFDKSVKSSQASVALLVKTINNISSEKIREAWKVDPSGIKELQQQLVDLQDTIAQMNQSTLASAVGGIDSALEKIKSKNGVIAQGARDVQEALKIGDVEAATAAYVRFSGALQSQVTAYQNLQQQKQELENIPEGNRTEEQQQQYEKLTAKLTESKRAYIELQEAILKGLNVGASEEDLRKLQLLRQQLEEAKYAAQEVGNTTRTTLVEGLHKSTKAFDESATAAKETGTTFVNTSNQAEQLINRFARFTTLSGIFTIISRSIKTAFNDVKELDAAMNNIAVVTDMTTKQLWGQIDTYTAMAKATGSSIKGTYEVAQLYYQQGLETNEVMQMTNETLKFARIAGLDYADATDYMTAALRGFNLETDQVQRINDIYSNLAANTASSQSEISIAMSKVASLAHSANMELETTSAFLAQIIATTRESPETAGTALKTVVARFAEVKKLYSEGQLLGTDEEGLEIDINKIDTALKTAGMSLNKFILGQQGLDEVFLELASKWDSLSVAQQRYIATQAAGSRQQSRFLALMQNYEGLMETLGYATNSAGKSQEQFDKTLESLQSKLNNLRTAWTQFITGIANESVIKTVVDLLTDILNTVNKLTGSFGGLGTAITRSLLAIGGLRAAGKVLEALGKTISSNIVTGVGTGLSKISFKTLSGNLVKSITSSLQGINLDLPITSSINRAYNKMVQAMNNDDMAAYVAATKEYDVAIQALNRSLLSAGLSQEEFNVMSNLGLDVRQKMVLATDAEAQGILRKYMALLQEKGATDAETQAELNNLKARLDNESAQKLSIASSIRNLALKVLESDIVTKLIGKYKILAVVQATINAGGIKGTLLALGVLGLIVGAVVGIIQVVKVLHREIAGSTVEARLTALREATEEAKNAAEKAKEAYDDLFNSQKEYNSLQAAIDNAVEGTDSFKEALREANEYVLELIDKYPQLAQYLNNKNGRLTISDEGFNKIQEYYNQEQYTNRAASYRMQIQSELLKQDQARSKIISDYLITTQPGAESWDVESIYKDFQNDAAWVSQLNTEGYTALLEFIQLVENSNKSIEGFNTAILNSSKELEDNPFKDTLTSLYGDRTNLRTPTNKEVIEQLSAFGLQEGGGGRRSRRRLLARYMYGENFTTEQFKDTSNFSNAKINDLLASYMGALDETFVDFSNKLKQSNISKDLTTTFEDIFKNSGENLTQGRIQEILGEDNNGIVEYFNNLSESINMSLDDIASALEYDNEDQMTKALTARLQAQNKAIDEAMAAIVHDGFNVQAIQDDLTSGLAQTLQIAFHEMRMKGFSISAQNGLSDIFNDLLEGLSDEMQDKVLTLITDTDFGRIDGIEGVNSFIKALDDMGVQTDGLRDKIVAATNAIRKFDFEKFSEQIGFVKDIIKDIQGREETERSFSSEDYEKIIELNPELAKDFYFDGTEYIYLGNSMSSLEAAIYEAIDVLRDENKLSVEEKIERGRQVENWIGNDEDRATGINNLFNGIDNDLIEGRSTLTANEARARGGDLAALVAQLDEYKNTFNIQLENWESATIGERLEAVQTQLDEIYGLNGQQLQTLEKEQLQALYSMAAGGSAQGIIDTQASTPEQTEAMTAALDGYIKSIEGAEAALQDLTDNGLANDKITKALAIDYARFISRIDDVNKAWEENKEVLKEGNKDSLKYRGSLTKLAKALSKAFNADVTEDFVESHMDLIDAMDESEESFDNFMLALAQSQGLEEFAAQANSSLAEIQAAADQLDNKSIELHGNADFSALFTQFAQAFGTAEEFKAAMEQLGFEAVLDFATTPVVAGSTGAVWSDYLKSITFKKANGGGSGGYTPPKAGGGGGGGGKENNSRPSQDPFYNYIKQREMREHQLKSLQDEAELLTDPYELFENTHQTEQRYQALYGATASYLNAVDDALGKLQDEARDKYSSYISFAEDGSLRLSEAYWNLTGETAEELDNWIDSYDDILGRQQDLTDELADYKKELKELWEGWRDDYIDLTNELADILKEIDEQILEDREEYYNEREEQDQKYLDSVKRNIEEERKARERSQAFEDLAKKQSRLALLQRDTSGMYANEIAKLQSEIDEDQQNMADESVDDILENLQRQLDEDAERHAEILDMMQKQIDANVESRVYIQEAEDVIAQGFEAVQELYQLGEEYRLASDAERSRQLEELKETFADAWKYLEELGEGITSAAEYVTKSINSQTEKVNEKITWAVGEISAAVKASAGSGGGGGGGGGGFTSSSAPTSSVGNRQKYTDIKGNVTSYNNGASWIGVVTARDAETGKNFYEKTTNAHRNIVEDWVSKKKASLATKKYKKGGLVDFTGPAWVDGSKSSPEAFLNPEQTQLIAALIQNLQRPAISNFERSSTSNVDNSQFNMEVYIEKLSNDYDLDAAIQKVKDEILSSAQYRNVNIVTRRR